MAGSRMAGAERMRVVERLGGCNPFTPERIALEREALGAAYVEEGRAWNAAAPVPGFGRNLELVLGEVRDWLDRMDREWPAAGLTPADSRTYEEVALFELFHRTCEGFDALIREALDGGGGRRPTHWAEFRRAIEQRLDRPGLRLPARPDPGVTFAFFFQLRRAFFHIYHFLVGGSEPMVRLRATIWESIFTHDLRRYRRSLVGRLGDFPLLITGASGTGKELVARAVGLSQHVPFDPATGHFVENFAAGFFPLNLAALSPTLIESELFGHRRGAFTGALGDRAGWLEVCPATGAVFLDELGEVAPAIQVKLLRVLQARTFQRLGETETRPFRGKIIGATHRDLGRLVAEGGMREDFYYRLSADRIGTPALAEQLAGDPGELARLVEFVARSLLGPDEAPAFAAAATRWIEEHLGLAYPWPGNFRELEQGVKALLVRGHYEPLARPPVVAGATDWERVWSEGTWTADRLLGEYCRRVYARTGSLKATAERLALDPRTVRARLED